MNNIYYELHICEDDNLTTKLKYGGNDKIEIIYECWGHNNEKIKCIVEIPRYALEKFLELIR